ncbi:hypothetical protein [Aquamicrobium sp. LC103]|uniref:hypothetical protein n=1 Tax=Aquamicrobium sp. LC103 TaxID=1120658 RepID=UPI00109D3DF1|nr:hypothetical protein [Aquamicrobium sp. LC103]TKT75490.1 hypothetical protein XW59_020435 [Aquamicrobium sp. LC103]
MKADPKPTDISQGGSREPLTDVLARLRIELEDIASRIDRGQALIAESTWAHGAGDAGYVSAMQDADLNAQRVAGVAGFLRALEQEAEPQWRVDTSAALAGVTLAEMALKLGGNAEEKPAENAGDVDFF